jgi:hypothetical protein
MYEHFNLLMLNEYSDYYLLFFAKMFTTENCESFIPNALKDFVKLPNKEKHLRNADNFIVPNHKTVFFTSCVKYRMVKLWNNVSTATKQKKYTELKFSVRQSIVNDRLS